VFYAVGGKTGEAVAEQGITPTMFPDVNDARSLAEAMLKLPRRGKRFLFPKGNLAGTELPDVLRSHGATVDEVVVYETVAPRDEDTKFLRESLALETIDVVTFFSPSSVRHLLTTVEREIFLSCIIATIGSSTAEAVEECGFKVGIVAPQPTAADLAEAIARYYSTNRETP
jgi:uroporphyrinogen-III synthase